MARGDDSLRLWASSVDERFEECECGDIIAVADRLCVSPTNAGVLGFLLVGEGMLALHHGKEATHNSVSDVVHVTSALTRAIRSLRLTECPRVFKRQTRLVSSKGGRLNSVLTTVWVIAPTTSSEALADALAQVDGITFMLVARGSVDVRQVSYAAPCILASYAIQGLRRTDDAVLLLAGAHRDLPTLLKNGDGKFKEHRQWVKLMNEVRGHQAMALSEHVRRVQQLRRRRTVSDSVLHASRGVKSRVRAFGSVPRPDRASPKQTRVRAGDSDEQTAHPRTDRASPKQTRVRAGDSVTRTDRASPKQTKVRAGDSVPRTDRACPKQTRVRLVRKTTLRVLVSGGDNIQEVSLGDGGGAPSGEHGRGSRSRKKDKREHSGASTRTIAVTPPHRVAGGGIMRSAGVRTPRVHAGPSGMCPERAQAGTHLVAAPENRIFEWVGKGIESMTAEATLLAGLCAMRTLKELPPCLRGEIEHEVIGVRVLLHLGWQMHGVHEPVPPDVLDDSIGRSPPEARPSPFLQGLSIANKKQFLSLQHRCLPYVRV